MANGKKPQSKEIDGIVYKKCQYCNEFKTLDNFYKNDNYFLGCQHWCKQCGSDYYKKRNTTEGNRIKRLKSKYDLTVEQYAQMYQEQEGKCAICWKVFELLNIDHDHETEEVRGLLCDHCNKGLGFFKDDLSFIANAFNYLLESMMNQ